MSASEYIIWVHLGECTRPISWVGVQGWRQGWAGVCVSLGPGCCPRPALHWAGEACFLVWKVGIIPALLVRLQKQ